MSCSLSAEAIMEEPAIRQGVCVTAGYVLVFYASVIGQTIARKKITWSYKARGEKVCQSEVLHGIFGVVCKGRRQCLWGRILINACTILHTIRAVARPRDASTLVVSLSYSTMWYLDTIPSRYASRSPHLSPLGCDFARRGIFHCVGVVFPSPHGMHV